MKAFKTFDICLQISLLVIIAVAAITGNPDKLNPMIFVLAFALMQIISLLVNMAAGKQYWKKATWRKYHLIGTGLVFLLILVALLQDYSGRTGDKDDKYSMPGLATILYTMIPILLSLFYVVITWTEWKKLKEKNKELKNN